MQRKDRDREFRIQLRRMLIAIIHAISGMVRWIEIEDDLKPTDR